MEFHQDVHPAAQLVFDRTKSDGTPRKLLDVRRLHQLGWQHHIELRPGIEATYEWFLEHQGRQPAMAQEAQTA